MGKRLPWKFLIPVFGRHENVNSNTPTKPSNKRRTSSTSSSSPCWVGPCCLVLCFPFLRNLVGLYCSTAHPHARATKAPRHDSATYHHHRCQQEAWYKNSGSVPGRDGGVLRPSFGRGVSPSRGHIHRPHRRRHRQHYRPRWPLRLPPHLFAEQATTRFIFDGRVEPARTGGR